MRNDLMPFVSPSAPAAAVPMHYVHPGLSLSQILAIARAYWKFTAGLTLAAIAVAIVVSKVMPKTYTATASLMVNYEVNDPLAGREFPIGLLGSYMSTQVELLGSPEVLLPVVDRVGLDKKEPYTSGFRGDPSTLPEWVAKGMSKNLQIQQGQYGNQMIYVTFSASSPQDAADVANAVVDVYGEKVHQRMTQPASEHAQRYGKELEDLKAKVDRAQEQVTKFRTESGLVEIEAKADIDIAVLNAQEQRLLEARNARRAAESRLAGDPTVSAGVLDSLLVQELRKQHSTLDAQMAELRATLGPKHPKVLQLKSQMDAVDKSLADETQRYASGAAADVRAAKDLEGKMAAAVEKQRLDLREVRRLQDDGAKYVLELESAKAAYKRALDGYDQVVIASRGQYKNINVVSRATPPLKPSKPKLMLNVLLGAFAGLFLGVVGPLMFELMSRRVRCRDDLERDHGIPVLVEFEPIPMRGA